MKGLIEGRLVHYVMMASDAPSEFAKYVNGKHRAAMVVKVWDEEGNTGTSNLTVFTDWSNDGNFELTANGNIGRPCMSRTSVPYSEDMEPGTWHWIEGSHAGAVAPVSDALTKTEAGGIFVTRANLEELIGEILLDKVKRNALL